MDTSHTCADKTPESDKTEVKHIDTEEESQDCPQSEYTTPFYTTNDQAKASVKCLKTTTKLHYMKNRDNEHIRPLWVAQSENSPNTPDRLQSQYRGWLQHPPSPQGQGTIW